MSASLQAVKNSSSIYIVANCRGRPEKHRSPDERQNSQSRSRLTLKQGELASTATAAAPASPGEQQET
jgi:hypothetical protein